MSRLDVQKASLGSRVQTSPATARMVPKITSLPIPSTSLSIHYLVKLKFLCLTNIAPRYESVWGSGCIDPRFLDLDTS
jgi:hypothetical protein